MRVTFVGAGALGRVYAVRLAALGDEIAFVVRPERVAEAAPFIAEQVNGPKRRDVIERPRLLADIPADAQLVVVTVRFDQLVPPQPHPADGAASADGQRALADLLRVGPAAPTVVLTPMMPPQRAALEQAVGRRVIPAMPNISGYLDERGVARYWVTGVASTLIDASAAPPDQHARLEELARRLTNAEVPARLERDVAEQNAATTTAFFPLIAAIDAAGGIDGVLASKATLSAALDAAKECEALAHKLGRVAPWAGLLTKFVGPFTLKPGVALARRMFPESVRFVEHHFGPKLHDQHLAMGETILAIGREHGASMPALERLMAQLRAGPAAR